MNGMRSGCQTVTLAMTSCNGVPCGHGHAPDLSTGTLGPDPTRHPGLSSGTGRAVRARCGHGPRLAGTNPHVRGAAPPDLAPLVTPAVERSTAVSTSKSPPGHARWGGTRALPGTLVPCSLWQPAMRWGEQAGAGERLSRSSLGSGCPAVSFPRAREAADHAGAHRISVASAGVPRRWRAPGPAGVPRGPDGPRVHATGALGTGASRLSKRTTQQGMDDLGGVPMRGGPRSQSEQAMLAV
jgi:hypothetical protein